LWLLRSHSFRRSCGDLASSTALTVIIKNERG
jgi:hypothetical protein